MSAFRGLNNSMRKRDLIYWRSMYLRVWTEVSVSGSSYYGIYVDTVVKFEVSS